MNKKHFHKYARLSFLLCTVVLLVDAHAADSIDASGQLEIMTLANGQAAEPAGLDIPKVEVVDRNNVNVMGQSVSITLPDVSIGTPPLNLEHSVRNPAGFLGAFAGLLDKYNGAVYEYQIQRDVGLPSAYFIQAMRVVSEHTAVDFEILDDGTYQPLIALHATLPSSPETLVVGPNNTYLYTKADGTVVTYTRTSTAAHSTGTIESIVRPNGFKINVDFSTNLNGKKIIRSVMANNGMQLKYLYVDTGSSTTLNWSRGYPTEVIAFNRAEEACDALADTCNFTKSWPKATYLWPTGMPDVLFNNNFSGTKVFSVTTAVGAKMDYHMKAYDVCGSECIAPLDLFVPRLSKIVKNNTVMTSYVYQNVMTRGATSGGGSLDLTVVKVPAPLSSVTSNGASWSYSRESASAITYVPDSFQRFHTSTGLGAMKVEFNSNYGSLMKVTQNQQGIKQSYLFDSLATHEQDGVVTSYEYDGRQNLEKTTTTAIGGASDTAVDIIREASYPETCTNRKTCNRPTWVKDAKGNQTDYVYHAESGQLTSTTLPANEGGVRAQTRYHYQQYTADYTGNDGSSIWLLASEAYCRNSAVTPSEANDLTVQACTGGDLVRTTYEYDSENLHLIGQVVTAQGEASTMRTCYQHDYMGRVIGTLPPKANVSKTSCVAN